LACTAALTILAVLDEENLIEGAKKKGEYLSKALTALCAKHSDLIGPERGVGLLRAVPLKGGLEARSILGPLRDRGLLVIVAGDAALRFCPPLIITEAELDQGVRILDEVLASLHPQKSAVAEGARV
jgi:acetylornithine/succinyldiaminopimelate/putrescine aminotransferase